MCAENPVVEAKIKETQALKDVARCTFWSRFPTDPELEYPDIKTTYPKDKIVTPPAYIRSNGDYR